MSRISVCCSGVTIDDVYTDMGVSFVSGKSLPAPAPNERPHIEIVFAGIVVSTGVERCDLSVSFCESSVRRTHDLL